MTVIAIDVEDGEPRPFDVAWANLAEQICEVFSQTDGRDPELARLPYEEYLKTDHWRVTRERKLLRAGGECQNRPCKYDAYFLLYWDRPRRDDERPRLEVHHLTYARLGREWESDLIVLCRHCHADTHGVPVR